MALPYLIGINPPAHLSRKIMALKAEVIKQCGLLPESAIDPHITLNLNRFMDIEAVGRAVSQVCANFECVKNHLEVQVDGFGTFPNINGTTVVFARVKSNPALQILQDAISLALAPMREGEMLRENLGEQSFTLKQLRDSTRYGYPYVGLEWQPHLTIACFNDESFMKFGKTLLIRALSEEFMVNELTLFS